MSICWVDRTCKLLTGVVLESAYSLLVLGFLKIHLKEEKKKLQVCWHVYTSNTGKFGHFVVFLLVLF